MHPLARLVFYILIFTFGTLHALPGYSATARPPIPRDKPEPPDAFLQSAKGRSYIDALASAEKGQLEKALAALPPDTEQMVKDLIWWSALTAGGRVSFHDARAFYQRRSDWPLPGTLRRRVEEAIDPRTPDTDILAWFNQHPPQTGQGHLDYAQALMRAGLPDKATHHLKAGWRTASLSTPQERQILSRYGKILESTDHIRRADYLLWQRARVQAHRLLPLLPDSYQALVKARSALMSFAYNVDAAIAAVPEELKNNAGLVYDRVYWRRIKGKNEGAEALLLETHVDGREIGHSSRWWRERHLQARRALKEGRIDAAYRLAAEHGMLDGLPDNTDEGEDLTQELPLQTRAQIADAEWLAGWIALRFENRPAIAMRHFQSMLSVVSYPVSLARGSYWSARAAEAMNDMALAARWYRAASSHPTVFYGQLAIDRLGADIGSLASNNITGPSAEDRAAFAAQDLVKAAHLLSRLGKDRALGHIIRHLVTTAKNPQEIELAAELGMTFKRPNIGVIAAKTASRDGAFLVDNGYPVIDMTGTSTLQKSLILSIARQESQFDPRAVSHVGALGLMQLMPATANRMARQLQKPYSKERLLGDPAYNLELGSRYFDQLLQRFNGSPILALAAYNAGPGAVNRWLRDNGDPRLEDADPIDWIEMIPYGETRNYVQRVLEAAPVYSLRLQNGKSAVSLSSLIGQEHADTADRALPFISPAAPGQTRGFPADDTTQ